MTVGLAALHELVLELVQNRYLLLAHRLAELVRLTLREAGQLLGKKHHLLLIDGHTVGVLEELLHLREVIFNRLESEFSVHEVRDVVHRARPVKGVHRDEVLETLRMQPLKPGLHALGFKLKDAVRVAVSIEFVSRLIVNRNRLDVDVRTKAQLNVVQTFVDYGQGVESQEVHLQHADFLDVVAVVLRSPDVLPRFLVHRKADRNIVGQVTSSDDRGAGVHSDLTDAALQLTGIFQNLPHLLCSVFQLFLELRHKTIAVLEGYLDIRVLHAPLIGLLDRFLLTRIVRIIDLDILFYNLESRLEIIQIRIERIFLIHLLAQAVRHHSGQAVGLIDRQVMDSRHVLDGSLGEHRAEGDHPGDVILAVGVLDIFMRQGQILEIDIYIRHRDSVRIQETLEQELVLDRIQVGDSQAIGHHGSGRGTTAWPHHAALRPRSRDVVLHNQEVVREAHTADGLKLEVYPLGLLGGQSLPITSFGSLVGDVAEIGHRLAELVATVIALLVALSDLDDILVHVQIVVQVVKEGLVDLILRKHMVAVDLIFLNFGSYLQSVFQHFRMVWEQCRHLLLALQVLLLGVVKARLLVDLLAGVQTDKMVVRRAVLLVDKVDVIRGDHLDTHLLSQLEYSFIADLLLLVDIPRESRNLGLVEHHLKVVVVSEDPLVPLYRLSRLVHLSGDDVLRDLARQTGGTADQILVVLLDDLVGDPRLAVIETFDVTLRHDLHQVFVAVEVLGQQDEVIIGFVLAVLDLRVVVACHIDLAPDDRLDLEMPGSLVHMLACELEELLDTVHVAVIRDGQGRHPHLLGPVEQGRDGGESVKNRILRVDVKVYKSHGDKSFFQAPSQTRPSPDKRLPTKGESQQYKDTEKPYPRKAALPEKLSTPRKKSRF